MPDTSASALVILSHLCSCDRGVKLNDQSNEENVNSIVMSQPLLNNFKNLLISCVGVLAISSFIALPAVSKPKNAPRANRDTSRSGTLYNRSLPRVHDGSTSYHQRGVSRITVEPTGPNPITSTGTRIRGTNNYPYGTRIDTNGNISLPRSKRITPSVSIPHGDGSTSYYYRDGSRVTIERSTIPTTGTRIR